MNAAIGSSEVRVCGSHAFPRARAALPALKTRVQPCKAVIGEDDAPSAPKRGVLILPGLGNSAADYSPLRAVLEAKGYKVSTAPVSRLDWSRNAAALTDGAWWRGALKPRPAVDWYLDRVNQAMQELKSSTDGAPITMLTHSAGGWLGRVYLLDFGSQGVDRYVSLGSPHAAPPQGVVDQTRGILTWITDACPGAYHNQISYTTVAGKFIQGIGLSGQGSALAKFAGAGYQQVCGEAEVWGDFIVPVRAAHLDGACNLDLDGVFHSPLGEKLPVFGPWYGSESVLPRWAWALDGSAPPATDGLTQPPETAVQQLAV